MQTLVDKYFTVCSDELLSRIDVGYYIDKILNAHANTSPYPLVSLGELLSAPPQYGANERAVKMTNADDIRYIRITDIANDGRLKPKGGVTAAKVNPKYELNDGDVLFARSGSVGRSLLYKGNDEKAIFAGYLIRFTFDASKVLPEYVFIYTQIQAYKNWVLKIARTAVQANINASEFKSLKLPLPPLDIQRRIVQNYEDIKHDTNEADEAYLEEVEQVFEKFLGMKRLPKQNSKKWFTVQSDELTERIDSSPYHPDRLNAIETIKSGNYTVKPLSEIVDFQKEQVKTISASRPYVGLENVVSNTGAYAPSLNSKLSISSASLFNKQNILFAKLRPYLNKVLLADFDGICSTEFHVLRCKEGVHPQYLRAFLASELIVRQTENLMTGNTLPRLQTGDVTSLLVPVPSFDIQQKIADEITKIQVEAERRNASQEEAKKSILSEIEKVIFS